MAKNGSDVVIGFSKKERVVRGGLQPHGLAFKMRVDERLEKYGIRIFEKGYYENNNMERYG